MRSKPADAGPQTELVIITGLSGSGKGTVLKAFEDLGYYSVDNLPIELIPKFAELTKNAPNIRRAALVVDIREGTALERLPATPIRSRPTAPRDRVRNGRMAPPVRARSPSRRGRRHAPS